MEQLYADGATPATRPIDRYPDHRLPTKPAARSLDTGVSQIAPHAAIIRPFSSASGNDAGRFDACSPVSRK